MSRLDIGRRVDEHVRPDTPALQGFAFARCCGFSSASIPHALTGKVGSGSRRFRPHAVAYDLWLPPAGSIRDLHPPPFIHARRTQSPYGLLPIPPRSLSLPTYSCVDPPPPSTLISRGEVSHRCWHRGLRLPANSPNLNAYAERFVLSIRRECLDRFVPLSERHLRTAVTEYVVHYHTERNHQGLGNELLTPLPASANDAGPIVSRERLGGILNYYCRAA